ncbi:MAG: hypothetical protein ACJ8IR_06380 [Alphaproteobacteria bacterium]
MQENEAVAGILTQLKEGGFSERAAEILLRNLAGIPDEWEQDKEPWPQTVKRRARLSKKLRALADDIANDPDLGQLSFDIRATYLNGEPEPGMVTFAQMLRSEAEGLEPNDRRRLVNADGVSMTASEYEKSTRPQRQVAERAYTLLAVFDLLQSFTKHKPNRPPRAPNREAEILAGIVLGEIIPAGTLTQLRKGDRRRYYRDG